MHSIKHSRLFFTLASILGAQAMASAQGTPQLLTSLPGPIPKAHAGQAICSLKDINNDFFPEIVVGQPGDVGSTVPGQVVIYSGNPSSPGVLATIVGTPGFGKAVADAGDVNGDGKNDILIGNPDVTSSTSRGAVYLYSGSDFARLQIYEGGDGVTPSGLPFGDVVAGIGDVNGDGRGDYAFRGRQLTSSGYVDAVYVYKGALPPQHGEFLYQIQGGTNSNFGAAITKVRDLNLDGRTDIAVGGASLRFFSGPSGSQLTQVSVPGKAIAELTLGDKFAVGNPDANQGRGQVTVLDLSTLQSSWTIAGQIPNERLGSSLAVMDDLSVDGQYELAIGVPGDLLPGYVTIRSGATGSEISRYVGSTNADRFGQAIAAIGDYGGDFRSDIVVGAPQADPSGLGDAGTALLFAYAFVNAPLGSNSCFCPNPGICNNGHSDPSGCHNSTTYNNAPGGGLLNAYGSASLGARSMFLVGTRMTPNAKANLVYGFSTLTNPAVFDDGYLCINNKQRYTLVNLSDAGGSLAVPPGFADNLVGVAQGAIFFQMWYRDGMTICPNAPSSNLTNMVQVDLVP